MTWGVIFFQTSRGEKPVKVFLESQGQIVMSKAAHKFELLKNYSPFLGMPYARKLETDLYELRIRGKDEFRIFYTFQGSIAYLLHVFRKKTQEIPQKELATARQRMKLLT